MMDFICAAAMALGLAFVGAGFAVASNYIVTAGFMGARLCFTFGAILFISSAVFWTWNSQLSIVPKVAVLSFIGIITFSPLFLAITWINALEIKTLPRLFPGVAEDPPSPKNCSAPPESLKIFFGSNLAWSTKFPHAVLQMGSDKMLVIDKDDKGRITIKLLRLFNDQNEIMVRFDEGDIWTAPGIRAPKLDKSTLVVFDKSDKEVLRVVYLNRQSIKISGIFVHPPAATVSIKDDILEIGGNSYSQNCFGNNGVDIRSR